MSLRIARPVSGSTVSTERTPRVVARVACALSALSILAAAGAQAADDAVWIEYRQTVMKGIGANMGGIGDILKNGLPLTGNIEFHASALAQSSQLIAPAFENAVSAGPTDAKPDIWKKPEEFAAAIGDMQKAAEALAATVDAGQMDQLGAKVKALGDSCGGCHKSFRKPKEESYKNK